MTKDHLGHVIQRTVDHNRRPQAFCLTCNEAIEGTLEELCKPRPVVEMRSPENPTSFFRFPKEDQNGERGKK